MKADDPTTDEPPFAHFLNEGATLVIDGYGSRLAIETTDENRHLCEWVDRTLSEHRSAAADTYLQWGEDGTRTAGMVRKVSSWRSPTREERKHQ